VAKLQSTLIENNVLFEDLQDRLSKAEMKFNRFMGDMTTDAKTLSLALSTEFNNIAETIATISEKSGYQLDRVTNKMYGLVDAADDSTMGFNNFYSAVQKMVTSLAMYNLKLDETAGLLSNVSEFLRPEQAKEFTENIASVGDMDFQEAVQTRQFAGPEAFDRILRNELQGMVTRNGRLVETLRQADLTGTDNLIGRIAGMSEDQFQDILGGVKKNAPSDQRFRRIRNALLGMRKFGSGPVSKMDATDYLGTDAAFRIRMQEVNRALDQMGKSLTKANSDQLAKMTNMNADMINQIQKFAPLAKEAMENIGETSVAELKEMGFDQVQRKNGQLVDETGEKITDWIDLMTSASAMDGEGQKDLRELMKTQVEETKEWTEDLKKMFNDMMRKLTDLVNKMDTIISSIPGVDKTPGQTEREGTRKAQDILTSTQKEPDEMDDKKSRDVTRALGKSQFGEFKKDKQDLQNMLETYVGSGNALKLKLEGAKRSVNLTPEGLAEWASFFDAKETLRKADDRKVTPESIMKFTKREMKNYLKGLPITPKEEGLPYDLFAPDKEIGPGTLSGGYTGSIRKLRAKMLEAVKEGHRNKEEIISYAQGATQSPFGNKVQESIYRDIANQIKRRKEKLDKTTKQKKSSQPKVPKTGDKTSMMTPVPNQSKPVDKRKQTQRNQYTFYIEGVGSKKDLKETVKKGINQAKETKVGLG
jgi:hypothetical protein